MGSQATELRLPALDASAWRSGDSIAQRRFAGDLTDCLKSHGFARIVNHGLTDDAIRDLHHWNRQFFQLPMQSKVDIAHPPGPQPQRGWSCVGAEQSAKLHRSRNCKDDSLAAHSLKDAREHFDHGAASNEQFPNRWPQENDLPGFQSFMENHYLSCTKLSVELLEALELAMNLSPGTLSLKCAGGASEMRLNHYPPIRVCDMRQGNTSRIWPHTDLGVLTFLFQDSVGGLEIEDRTNPGSFFPVLRESWNEMIINVSETLERWTDGQLPAGVHQVTVPPGLKEEDEAIMPARFSNAFFVKADCEADVGTLPQMIEPGASGKYKSMTALEYHRQRVASAY